MFSLQVAVFALLVLFGVGYNALVSEMERRKVQGYTWHQVAGGVLATLIGAAFLIGWQAAALVGLCMLASGTPMITGAWLRHRALERAYKARLEEIARSAGGHERQA